MTVYNITLLLVLLMRFSHSGWNKADKIVSTVLYMREGMEIQYFTSYLGISNSMIVRRGGVDNLQPLLRSNPYDCDTYPISAGAQLV